MYDNHDDDELPANALSVAQKLCLQIECRCRVDLLTLTICHCLDAILQIATTICVINSDVVWIMIETGRSNSSRKHSKCIFSNRLSYVFVLVKIYYILWSTPKTDPEIVLRW